MTVLRTDQESGHTRIPVREDGWRSPRASGFNRSARCLALVLLSAQEAAMAHPGGALVGPGGEDRVTAPEAAAVAAVLEDLHGKRDAGRFQGERVAQAVLDRHAI